MEAGLVGLPYSGKTTLWKALTGLVPEDLSGVRPNVGVAPIPDPNLDAIARHIQTQKIVPATLKVVDIPGLMRGSSEGAGMGNAFLAHIRDVEALIHVVRCFTNPDVAHVDGSIDPIRDIETVELELIFADLQMVENAIPRAEKAARSKSPDALARLAVLHRAKPILEGGRGVLGMEVHGEEEAKALRGLAMLSGKPTLYVANVDDNDPGGESEHAQSVRRHAQERGAAFVPVCARIESELAELEEPDRSEMLASLGLREPALHRLAREAYGLLGLQSFYTAGPKEIRAWTIPRGSTAPQAAGAIHSDFERGFIRVEVYQVSDLTALKSEKAIKDAGRLRVEGKSYVMRDGDVCHFLFNV